MSEDNEKKAGGDNLPAPVKKPDQKITLTDNRRHVKPGVLFAAAVVLALAILSIVLLSRLNATRSELESARTTVTEKETELAKTAGELEDANKTLAQTQEQLTATENERDAARDDQATAESALAESEKKLADTQAELETSRKELVSATDLTARLQSDLSEKQKELDSVTGLYSAAQGELADLQMQLSQVATVMDLPADSPAEGSLQGYTFTVPGGCTYRRESAGTASYYYGQAVLRCSVIDTATAADLLTGEGRAEGYAAFADAVSAELPVSAREEITVDGTPAMLLSGEYEGRAFCTLIWSGHPDAMFTATCVTANGSVASAVGVMDDLTGSLRWNAAE